MTADTAALAEARERVAALCAALEADEGQPVRLIETHISWVLLTNTLAYKLKKPVRLPFLDFTALAARRHFCAEELRLNRRFAPALYLDVIEVVATPAGPRFAGTGPALDVALRMRRFPDGALWSERLSAGTLAPQHIDALAQRLADFHREAAVAGADSGFGSTAIHQRITRGLIDATDAWLGSAAVRDPPVDWPALRTWLLGQLATLAPRWEARRSNGRVRECHGDLHLANVVQLGDEPTAFDAIEFDPELRWIDVLDDIAFLAMDLWTHREPGLAMRFVNAYLEASGDWDGLPLLRFQMVCRALVRAQVTALAGGQGLHSAMRCGATEYLALAAALSVGADPHLAITHGLPGSGKSIVSQAVSEAAAAIRVRSDVERKRLFGLGALESSAGRVAGGIYDAATTERTYARLHEIARIALGAGWPVIVDAAFLRHAERAPFAALAGALHVPFAIFDCRAAWPVLNERLGQRRRRGGDASEADEAVLERLRDADEPLDDVAAARSFVIDAAQPVAPADLARHWLARR
jgi:uncharacterized protein